MKAQSAQSMEVYKRGCGILDAGCGIQGKSAFVPRLLSCIPYLASRNVYEQVLLSLSTSALRSSLGGIHSITLGRQDMSTISPSAHSFQAKHLPAKTGFWALIPPSPTSIRVQSCTRPASRRAASRAARSFPSTEAGRRTAAGSHRLMISEMIGTWVSAR